MDSFQARGRGHQDIIHLLEHLGGARGVPEGKITGQFLAEEDWRILETLWEPGPTKLDERGKGSSGVRVSRIR